MFRVQILSAILRLVVDKIMDITYGKIIAGYFITLYREPSRLKYYII